MAQQVVKHSPALKDLTVGTPWKVILFFSIPILLASFIQQIFTFCDALVVGQALGSSSFAAVGVTGNISYVYLIFISGFISGLSVLIAKFFGAGDFDEVRHSIAVSMVLCLIAGIVLTVVAIALNDLSFAWAGLIPGTAVYEQARTYILIIYAGIIFNFLFNMLLSALRSVGDSKSTLIFLGLFVFLNIGFDLLFAVVFKLGVAGVAFASDLSNFLSFVLIAIWMYVRYPSLHLHKKDFRLNWSFVRQHLRLGLPLAAQFSIIGIGIFYMQSAIDVYGSDAISAYSVGSKVTGFFCFPLASVGSAMAAYVGQNYGAKKFDRIRKGTIDMFLAFLGYSLIAGLISFFIKDSVVTIFMSDANQTTKDLCSTYLVFASFGYAFLGWIYLFRNTVQSIEKPIWPLLSGLTELTIRTVVCLILPTYLGFTGAALADPIAWVFSSLVLGVGILIHVLPKNKHGDGDLSNPQPEATPNK